MTQLMNQRFADRDDNLAVIVVAIFFDQFWNSVMRSGSWLP